MGCVELHQMSRMFSGEVINNAHLVMFLVRFTFWCCKSSSTLLYRIFFRVLCCDLVHISLYTCYAASLTGLSLDLLLPQATYPHSGDKKKEIK